MKTFGNLLDEGRELLSGNENCDSDFEIRELVKYVFGTDTLLIGKTEQVPFEKERQFVSLCRKRKEGYPLQYIIGEWDFMDITLKVGEGVLIPRSDTECVVEKALEYLKGRENPFVADFCSGSGNIALAIKKYCPSANVVAVEKEDRAFRFLSKNIKNTGIPVLPVQGDVFEIDDAFEENTVDLIISNPPYIDTNLKGRLQKEVGYEPDEALFAGSHGTAFYRYIAHYYKKALKNEGLLVFEYGYDQKKTVTKILLNDNYSIREYITDYSGLDRGVVAEVVK